MTHVTPKEVRALLAAKDAEIERLGEVLAQTCQEVDDYVDAFGSTTHRDGITPDVIREEIVALRAYCARLTRERDEWAEHAAEIVQLHGGENERRQSNKGTALSMLVACLANERDEAVAALEKASSVGREWRVNILGSWCNARSQHDVLEARKRGCDVQFRPLVYGDWQPDDGAEP